MEQREQDELIKLIKSAITAIDGLWFLEAENALGFDRAFEIDLEVWKKYGPVMIKRIKRMLSITDNNLESFLRVLRIVCEIDGTKFSIKEQSENEALILIDYCPWYENLKRSHREKLVRCDIVDKTIFPAWIESFNPGLTFELYRSIPEGHSRCEWKIQIKERN
jgi:hypothetical protein